jgi:propionate CoA-transferase
VTFSGKRARRVGQEVLYVTESAVFRLTEQGLRLEEVAPGMELERDIFPQLGFRPLVAEPVKPMAAELFRDELLPRKLFSYFH